MAPPGAIIWQHPPPIRNHLLPHDKHAHAAVTPQENALTSSGCTTHLIIGWEQNNLWAAARLRVTIWREHVFLQDSHMKDLLSPPFVREKYEGVTIFTSWCGHVYVISMHIQVIHFPMLGWKSNCYRWEMGTWSCWSWQHPDFSSLH